MGFPGGAVVKNSPEKAEDAGDRVFNPSVGKTPRKGNVNPLQYSCLENPMGRGVLQATVHAVAELDTTEAT